MSDIGNFFHSPRCRSFNLLHMPDRSIKKYLFQTGAVMFEQNKYACHVDILNMQYPVARTNDISPGIQGFIFKNVKYIGMDYFLSKAWTATP